MKWIIAFIRFISKPTHNLIEWVGVVTFSVAMTNDEDIFVLATVVLSTIIASCSANILIEAIDSVNNLGDR